MNAGVCAAEILLDTQEVTDSSSVGPTIFPIKTLLDDEQALNVEAKNKQSALNSGPDSGPALSAGQHTVLYQQKWEEKRALYANKDKFILMASEVAMLAVGFLRIKNTDPIIVKADDMKYLRSLDRGPRVHVSGRPIPGQQIFRWHAADTIRWIESTAFDLDIALIEKVQYGARLQRDAKLRAEHQYEELVNSRALEIVAHLQDKAFAERIRARVTAVCEEEIAEALAPVLPDDRPIELVRMDINNLLNTIPDQALKVAFDHLVEPWLVELTKQDDPEDRDLVQYALRVVQKASRYKDWIYVLKPMGIRAVKLGFTGNEGRYRTPGEALSTRMAGVQTGCPTQLICMAAFPGNTDAELRLHQIFRKTRLVGEWFVLDATMRAFIAAVHEHLRGTLAATEGSKLRRLDRLVDYFEGQPKEPATPAPAGAL